MAAPVDGPTSVPMSKVKVPSFTRIPAAFANVSESSSPEGPYLPKTVLARPETIEDVPLVVRVLTVVGAVIVVSALTEALKVSPIVLMSWVVSAEVSARPKPFTESRVRKPVPGPASVSSTRMSPRTDLVVVPFAPPPWRPEKFRSVTMRLALPAPLTALRPVKTSDPAVCTTFTVIEPAAVALALRTRDVESSILRMVAPAGIPAPKTCMPGMSPCVLVSPVRLGEALVVVALSEALAYASPPMFSVRALPL